MEHIFLQEHLYDTRRYTYNTHIWKVSIDSLLSQIDILGSIHFFINIAQNTYFLDMWYLCNDCFLMRALSLTKHLHANLTLISECNVIFVNYVHCATLTEKVVFPNNAGNSISFLENFISDCAAVKAQNYLTLVGCL